MTEYDELSKISRVNKKMYLSGVHPLEIKPQEIGKNNIKTILCCVPKAHAEKYHKFVIDKYPNINILYLPYNDDVNQNLWQRNTNLIKMYCQTNDKQFFNSMINKMDSYSDRPMIDIGYDFIDRSIQGNGNILIHCMAGISRSASLTIYYLMKKYSVSYDEAYNYVKNKRKIIDPNSCFKLQLQSYSEERDKFTYKNAEDIVSKFNQESNEIEPSRVSSIKTAINVRVQQAYSSAIPEGIKQNLVLQ